MKAQWPTTLLMLVWSAILMAQPRTKGSITGTVLDRQTRQPLPGVNVVIKGTYMGAATDEKGRYLIERVSPGQYDIEASMIGYKIQLHTGVKVSAGQQVVLNFELEQSVLAFGQEVVVIGERPLLQVDLTASEVHFSADDIRHRIVENVQDIVTQQAGVVRADNEIHIRGGRADESLYIVDGISIKDPLSGYGNTLYVNADAIKELKVITGGFNAEYGQAMSGVIDVVTKEGGDSYGGGLTVKSDRPSLGLFTSYNTQVVEFNLGGPEPLTARVLPALGIRLPGNLSFFLSGYGNVSDTYLPTASRLYPSRSGLRIFAPRQENDWHLLGKLSWKVNPNQRLSFSYDRSLNINQGFFRRYVISRRYFPYEFSKHLDHYPTFTSESILANASWMHTLSSRTFYELTVGNFFTSTHSAVQNKHWSQYVEQLDLEPVRYVPSSTGDIVIRRGDGFYDHGDYGQWFDYFSDTWTVKGDLTSQVDPKHQVKGGFEVGYTTMQVVDIVDPWVRSESGYGRSYDIYRVYSTAGAFYLQDRITYEGMIVNVGLRYDYWFPGKFVQDAIDDPETVIISAAARKRFYEDTFEFLGMRGKGHLSPRVGISHPVTDRDVLYFHYGHFSQRPQGQYVYAKLKSTSPATYQLFGNPNLNPTTTVAYELGIKHKFTENLVAEFKAYYKDMFDYPTAERVQMENPRLGNISYLMYFNMDYARSKGIELWVRQRYARYLTGTLNFTYAVSKGKSSKPSDNLLVEAGRLAEKPLRENFLEWDRPFRLTLDLNVHVGEKQGFRLFGWRLPEKWGINSHWEMESGKRYTRLIDIEREIYDTAHPYANLAPTWHQLDVRAYKYYRLKGVEINLQVEIENAFNARIPRIINPYTGREYRPGDILTKSYTRDINPSPNPIYDPSKFRWPRTVRWGVGVRF
ncbi:MAG: TonB-dependent receptor [candidate division KSB1 bacterium]|nr:TonB-dependent receptor [candidate division KSB1 bacterium]